MNKNQQDTVIRKLLQQTRNIAVVGLSDKVNRDSYRVAQYMQEKGYRIIPVNPRVKTVLGEKAYSNILDIPEKVDIVNIFRSSDQVLPIVKDAINIKPKAIWLQLGIINNEAAQLCTNIEIHFIMDTCIKIEHSRLFLDH